MARVQPMDSLVQVLANVGATDDTAVAYGDGIKSVRFENPGVVSLELNEPAPFGNVSVTEAAVFVSLPSTPGCFVTYGFPDANHFNVAFVDAAGDPFPGGGSCSIMIMIRSLPLVNFDPPLP